MTGKTGCFRMVAWIYRGMAFVDNEGLSTGVRSSTALSPSFGWFAQGVVHRGCLILAVSSWTRL